MTPDLLLVGCGSHGRVVLDLYRQCGRLGEVAGFLDAFVEESPDPRRVRDVAVLGGLGLLERALSLGLARFIVPIGDNRVREQLTERGLAAGLLLDTIVSPAASVAADVAIGPGTMISAGAVVVTGASIGQGVIVNTGATVDHDDRLDDFVHVCPGAHLAGNVEVGRRTMIGIGASVIQEIRIGADVTVGAGAAVVSDLADGVTAIGVPARVWSRP